MFLSVDLITLPITIKDVSTVTEKKRNYVALGLIIGAAIGTFVFIYTQQAMHIGFGAALGLIAGAMITSNQK